jgi:hypothetical protein
MDHLREEGRDVPGDLAPQRLGGASPDAFGPDEHAATSLSSARAISSRIASTESLLSPASGGRGTRLVAASGSFSSARPRWATRAWPTAPLARDPLTDTTGNRRPKSGCPGSVTSISTKSPSSGFWKGVPTDVLVGCGETLHSCSCRLFEEPGLRFQAFDVDTFSAASADVDGDEFAALDTLQHGPARDAEPTDGFAHGEEAVRDGGGEALS